VEKSKGTNLNLNGRVTTTTAVLENVLMIPQRKMIVHRLITNDARWKSIKKVYDRFETLPLEDWRFLTQWLIERKRLITSLRTYGFKYHDNVIDA
jgi:hypothetical protein